jgi:nitroimidazol reductase NimA-like FMN-containing flavoprotein (pyridoxamine 5'-phosphate oxidase superfamily)
MTDHNVAALVAYDCWALLEAAEIARVGWLGPDGVALVPVDYAVDGGALWFRTDRGTRLARECDGADLVVEVDRIEPDGRGAWSVVVGGTATLVDALDVPDALVEMRVWPGGSHSPFVRVEPESVSGRRLWGARPTPGDPDARP